MPFPSHSALSQWMLWKYWIEQSKLHIAHAKTADYVLPATVLQAINAVMAIIIFTCRNAIGQRQCWWWQRVHAKPSQYGDGKRSPQVNVLLIRETLALAMHRCGVGLAAQQRCAYTPSVRWVVEKIVSSWRNAHSWLSVERDCCCWHTFLQLSLHCSIPSS